VREGVIPTGACTRLRVESSRAIGRACHACRTANGGRRVEISKGGLKDRTSDAGGGN
jgi:hypothetical protein